MYYQGVDADFQARLDARSAATLRWRLDDDILKLNLEPIAFLLATEQNWSLQELDAIELEYRCFLQLARDFPDVPLVPSRNCDLYWHAHILTLELYLDDCQRLFGRPLLHYPFSGRLGDDDAALQSDRFRKSRQLLAGLVSRVRSTQTPTVKESWHETDSNEVSQPC